MNKKWQTKKIGDFLTLEYGKPLDRSLRKQNGKYPAYGANGVKAWSDEFYYDKKTIIIGRKGSAGEITLTDDKFWPLDVTYFIKFDERKYDLYFLYYMLLCLNLTSLAIGVKPGINRNHIYKIEVNVPNIQEQKRIVAVLDQAFVDIEKIRANTEMNLKNARELFESYLQEVFSQRGEGWTDKTLLEICTINPPKKEAREILSSNDLVSFVPMNCLGINKKDLILKNKKKLDEVVGSYTYFSENDVLLAKITPCFENGKLGIARTLENGVGFGSSEYIVFRCKGDLLPDYLYFYLSQESFRELGKARMTGAVGHKRISKEFIENYKLWLPTISQQKNIVKNIEKLKKNISELEDVYKNKSLQLEQLKHSFLHQAFTGQLTKQEVVV